MMKDDKKWEELRDARDQGRVQGDEDERDK